MAAARQRVGVRRHGDQLHRAELMRPASRPRGPVSSGPAGLSASSSGRRRLPQLLLALFIVVPHLGRPPPTPTPWMAAAARAVRSGRQRGRICASSHKGMRGATCTCSTRRSSMWTSTTSSSTTTTLCKRSPPVGYFGDCFGDGRAELLLPLVVT